MSNIKKGVIVCDNFCLVRKIGEGAFGVVFLGIDITTGKEMAVKRESIRARRLLLKHEFEVYKSLYGGLGIPKIWYYGEEEEYNFLIMDLIGPSLEDLFKSCSRRFTMKTILMLADQMIPLFAHVHSKSIIHRDIKPENFLMRLGTQRNKLFLIDFGLAKQFRDPRTRSHHSFRGDEPGVGTASYSSINMHLSIGQTRRDDMESLGYVLMYFNRGRLPWQSVKSGTKRQKYEMICEKKMSISIQELCDGFPTEFSTYLKYCRGLGFAEKPDYNYLRCLFRALMRRLNHQYDYAFDWTMLKQEALGTAGDIGTSTQDQTSNAITQQPENL